MKRTLGIIVSVAALILPACDNTGSTTTTSTTTTSTTATSTTAPWVPQEGLDFKEPDQVWSKDHILEITLEAKSPETIEVSGQKLIARPFKATTGTHANPSGKDFGFKLNGPTLHVNGGDTIRVTFVNHLGKDQVTNIHYHGLNVDPKDYGDNIFREFKDGDTNLSQVTLPINHPLGTYWYHVHPHGSSEEQVMGGLSGLLIIEGTVQLLPSQLQNIPQHQFAFRDVQTCSNTNNEAQICGENEINPNKPSIRLVNGLYKPKLEMTEGQPEFWRLANIGSDVFYRIALVRIGRTAAVPLTVLAQDGLLVWMPPLVEFLPKDEELLLPPGLRFDALVPGLEPGIYELRSLPYAQHAVLKTEGKEPVIEPQPVPAQDTTLATITVKPKPAGIAVAPAAPLTTGLIPSEDLSNAPIAERHTLVFSYGTDPSTKKFQGWINGKAFTHGMMPAVSPVLNTVEEWVLENATTDDHPFHIHVNDFQVMSVNGEPYNTNHHQDVVIIPKQYTKNGQVVNGQVVIRIKFEGFYGWFVYHCHILKHEDEGMMATIQVRQNATDPITPPPSPPPPPTPPPLPSGAM